MLIAALLAVLGVPHYRLIPWFDPITRKSDLDGLMKLRGIQHDPSVSAMLGYWTGDDPQRVHTFRPLPATILWAEFHLWGWDRFPYMVTNMLWFIATALSLVWLCRIIRMPWMAAVGAGGLLMLLPTRGSLGALRLVATLHDLTCTIFALIAFGLLIRYLRDGRRSSLLAASLLMLGAYLSKEMALTLVPLTVVIAIVYRPEAPLRRQLSAIGAAVAVGLLWFGWYQLAQANMQSVNPPEHSFAGLTGLLAMRWRSSLWLLLGLVARPIAALASRLEAAVHVRAGALMLFDYEFLEPLGLSVLFVIAFWLLWVEKRRWLAVLYAWKLCTYIPIIPLVDTFPWYEYMPHALDPILPAGAIVVGWRRWSVAERAKALWRNFRWSFADVNQQSTQSSTTDREAR